MSAFVADAADPGIQTVLRWIADRGQRGDELLILGPEAIEARDPALAAAHGAGIGLVPIAGEAWLPGASCAIRAIGTPRLLDIASRSALEVVTCGEPGTSRPPGSAEAAFERIAVLPADIDLAEARLLYRLAQAAKGDAIVFDLGGRSATVVATARQLADARPPAIVVEDRPSARADELRSALEANLRASGVLELVCIEEDLDAVLERDPPLGLVVLPRTLDYMGAHVLGRAFDGLLDDGALVVCPSPGLGRRGGELAVREMVRAGMVPPLQGRVGNLDVHSGALPDGIVLDPPSASSAQQGGTTRKAEPESDDSKHYLSGRHIDAFVAKHAPKLAGRVIDHGCGNKPFEGLLVNSTAVVGVDIRQSSEHKADVLVRPREELPFPSGWFDNGLCTEVLEHCEEPGEVLRELGRVIRPGGCLLVSTPFVWPLHEEPRDFFRFSPHGLRYLLGAAGFDVVDQAAGGGLWEVVYQLRTALMDGYTETARHHIRALNMEGAERDASDPHPEVSLHYPTLARRTGKL